jgi:hypothetical protein
LRNTETLVEEEDEDDEKKKKKKKTTTTTTTTAKKKKQAGCRGVQSSRIRVRGFFLSIFLFSPVECFLHVN